MLSTKNISKSFGTLHILKDIRLDIQRGEIVGITGASGTGKSTLLHIIGTLDTPDAGTLTIDNTDVFALPSSQLARFRNQKIGFVFQFHHLLPEFTACENIAMPAMINHLSKKEAEKKAMDLLDMLQLTNRAKHKPAELSGGEQQRVAIARALINNPAVVLADEPTGNLDNHNSQAIFDLITRLRNELNQTFIMVTHNDDLAQQCDRVLKMQDGKII